MKAVFLRGLGLAFVLALAGCETTGPLPTEVTRFHLDQPIARGEIAVEPFEHGDAGSLEFRAYADAVGRQLAALGWTVVPPGRSEQVAAVAFEQGSHPGPRRSPVSIGIGGATGGWNSGVGGGISFPIGGGPRGPIVESMMSVRIQRRSDATVMWEGRAHTAARGDAPDASPGGAAEKLAAALFQGFPGDSGRTITVK